MILILTKKPSQRQHYIFNLMLEELLGLKFSFTHSAEEFRSYAGPKFIYGKNPTDDESLYLASAGLLYEKGVGSPSIQAVDHEGEKALFPVYERNAALPFDPFSAAFFMVTRYEEYMPYRKDMYGRFTAMESSAYKLGFLHKPVVNIWTIQLGNLLQQRFPDLKIKKLQYKFIPTYDIDQAWAFKGKGFARIAGAYLKSLARTDLKDVVQRTKVIAGMEPDPFDNFDYQLDLQKRYQLHPVYFFLFGSYGEYDKNIPVTNTRFRQLIKRIADYADTGIHPSYKSNSQPEELRREVGELSKVLNREIIRSRQHFLKLHIPETYFNLADLNISMDYTMGYAALPGFRAGICRPYTFYDVDMETTIPITVVPFAVMDCTLRDYMNLSPDVAIQTINQLIAEVKKVGGVFSSLWHNESLSETGHWKGWRRVYEELVKTATN